jgi:hypothetical protein
MGIERIPNPFQAAQAGGGIGNRKFVMDNNCAGRTAAASGKGRAKFA